MRMGLYAKDPAGRAHGAGARKSRSASKSDTQPGEVERVLLEIIEILIVLAGCNLEGQGVNPSE